MPHVIIDMPYEDISKTLKDIKYKSKTNQILHYQAASFFQNVAYCITLPMIFFNSSLSIVNLTYTSEVPYVISSMLLLNAFLVGTRDYLRIDKRITYHLHLSTEFGSLAQDIELNKSDVALIPVIRKYQELTRLIEFQIPPYVIKRIKRTTNLPTIFQRVEDLHSTTPRKDLVESDT